MLFQVSSWGGGDFTADLVPRKCQSLPCQNWMGFVVVVMVNMVLKMGILFLGKF